MPSDNQIPTVCELPSEAAVRISDMVRVQPVIASGCNHDCLDLDDECVDVPDPLACYQYDPKRGRCPLLRWRQN